MAKDDSGGIERSEASQKGEVDRNIPIDVWWQHWGAALVFIRACQQLYQLSC